MKELLEKCGAIKLMKKKSTFQKITMVIVWLMIISTVGSLVLGALSGLGLLNFS